MPADGRLFATIALVALSWPAAGCGESQRHVTETALEGGVEGPIAADAGVGPPAVACTGLQCNVATNCPDGGTTISGTVYDPAGVTPVSDAVVYIPKDSAAPLAPTSPGIRSCSFACNPILATIGTSYLTVAVTDPKGAFTLTGVPTGTSIPVIVQVGKWRRKVTVETKSCVDTPIAPSLTRLPRNQTEGDIPQMAIVTGGCDGLACLVRSIGLDATEFTGPAGGGRLHVYRGAGPGPDLAGGGPGPAGDCSVAGCTLWDQKSSLEEYDLVLLGCECGVHDETKPAASIQAMHDWLSEGGRLLATHYQDTWFKNGPSDFQGFAHWLPSESDGPTPGPFQENDSSGRSLGMKNWLGALGLLNPDGTIPLAPADVSQSLSGASAPTLSWIYDVSSSTPVPKVISAATPLGGMRLGDAGETPLAYCGRVMFTDIHAGGGGAFSSAPVPATCSGSTSAELKTLEYLFFDLNGVCWLPPPPPPPPPPPGP
jgi:hypothetical protein